MSRLLQRLATQAATPSGGPAAISLIRPAARMQAHAPAWMTRDNPQGQPLLQAFNSSATAEHAPNASAVLTEEVMREPAGPSLHRDPQEQVRRVGPTEQEARTPSTFPTFAHAAVPLESPIQATTREFGRRAPEPLLAEGPKKSGAPSPILPITPPRVVAQAERTRVSAEPNEVHVHIGRIEVTAVQESGPPKSPRASAARDTMPLSEFLARKRRI